MARAALFVSDLHLDAGREESNRQFEAFLAGPAARAGALYILGDLFESWAGDDDLGEPFNARICAALRALTQGVPVWFMAGNRDFLADERFAAASGVRLLAEPATIQPDGMPTLLLHGDTLCTDDADYQRWRAQVRSPHWRERFLAAALPERKARIASLRAMSEQAKRVKPPEVMDINAGALARLLREHGYPHVIHGHTHRPGHHVVEIDGRVCERWVLADWYTGGSFLACEDGRWSMIELPPAP